MRFPRSGGVLIHPTSFPGRYGIGDLGDSAFTFLDFLVKSKQSIWQVLPLGPTGYGDSPYQSFSAFAGNPLLISPEGLVRENFLPAAALENPPDFPVHRVDFGSVIQYKQKLLWQAFEHFQVFRSPDQWNDYEQFCHEQAHWLDDFALFMAIKSLTVHQKGGVWNTWPREIAFREPGAVAAWSEKMVDQTALFKFQQFLFYQQWTSLKTYANQRNILIFGDAPIFVAFDSADVWANRRLFDLNEDGSPSHIAGVPPDYFSETGQRWGNPLYRWELLAQDRYAWWADRLRMLFTQVDIVRIDHFRGFEAYWSIPAEEPTAVVGEWVKGPGADFIRAMQDALGSKELPIIAEDLGVITPEVIELRDRFNFPGMKILQFAFGGERNPVFLPHNYETPNCVVYCGTHDNETTMGWYRNADEQERDHVRRYLATDGRDIAWDMIRLAFASVADIAVVTMQDLMNLGNEARMNYPGFSSGYWQWRYVPGMLRDSIASGLAEFAELFDRTHDREETASPDKQ